MRGYSRTYLHSMLLFELREDNATLIPVSVGTTRYIGKITAGKAFFDIFGALLARTCASCGMRLGLST